MEEEKIEKKEKKRGKGAPFIPAGVLLGMGVGFALDNLPAGLFIGLGLGFAAFAVSLFIEK